MEIVCTDAGNEEFLLLCGRLDAYLNDLVGGEVNRAEYLEYNMAEDLELALLAFLDGQAAGGAGLKQVEGKTAEVKRVFVQPEYRGKGIGEALLKRLEAEAAGRGYERLVLETGELLEAATGLYRKLGYVVIQNYGPYVDLPESLCMGKRIGRDTHRQ